MSLVDTTNETIATIGGHVLRVDVDSDSSFDPSHWVYIYDEMDDEVTHRISYEEAAKLHDRLGRILGKPTATPGPVRYRRVGGAKGNVKVGDLVRSKWSAAGAIWRVEAVREASSAHSQKSYGDVLELRSLNSGRADIRHAYNFDIVQPVTPTTEGAPTA